MLLKQSCLNDDCNVADIQTDTIGEREREVTPRPHIDIIGGLECETCSLVLLLIKNIAFWNTHTHTHTNTRTHNSSRLLLT